MTLHPPLRRPRAPTAVGWTVETRRSPPRYAVGPGPAAYGSMGAVNAQPVADPLAIAALDEGLHLASGPRFAVGHGLDRWIRIPHVAAPEVQRDAVLRLVRAHARVAGGEALRGAPREAPPIVA